MAVILNKWVEKERKKKVHQTAPAYEADDTDSFQVSAKKAERTSTASSATMIKTLRGVRK